MLGLPDGVTACLFDLDGVLTETAIVHAAAWKEMFDDFLRERAERTGTTFVPFDAHADYDAYVDGKPRLRRRAVVPGSPAASSCPRASPTTRRHADGPRPGQPQERARAGRADRRAASRSSRARSRYLEAVRDAGLRRAVVSSSANTAQVLDVAGLADLFERAGRRRTSPTEHGLHGKPAPDTFLAAARARSSVDAGAGGRVRGRAGRRRGRAAPGGFGFVVGVDRVGQAEALREHGADVVVDGPRRAARRTPHDHAVARSRSSRGRCARPQLDLDLLAQTESVFALSNGHIGLRGNLDEGEPYGLPGTYLNSFYELRPLPYAEAGYGYPESGQTIVNVTNGKIIRLLVDDEPFDVRYGDAARARAGAGPAGRHADPDGGLDVPGRGQRSRSVARGWSRSPSARSPPSATRSRRSTGRCGSCVQSELVANEELPSRGKDPRVAAVLENAAGQRGGPVLQRRRPARALLVHRTRASGLRVAAGMDHVVDAARTEIGEPGRVRARLGPGHRGVRARARRAAAASSSSSPTAGRACGPGRRCATRSSAALAGAPTTGWDGLLDGAARRTWTTSGTAPTSRSTATPSSSRRCGSGCSTCCRPARGPSAGRSRPRA